MKTLDDLSEFIQDHLLNHVGDADFLGVHRGIIDKGAFKIPSGWPILGNIEGAEFFQTNDALLFVPEDDSDALTILATPKDVGEAILQVITSDEWRSLSLSFHMRKALDAIKDLLQYGLAATSKPATEHTEELDARECIIRAAASVDKLPWLWAKRKGFVQEAPRIFASQIQQAAYPVAVDWNNYDFGIINKDVFYATKDIRSRIARCQHAFLRVLPLYVFEQ